MFQEALRPVWAEINLDNIDYNMKQIRNKVGDKEIFGVLKADAYGHGAVAVSKVLLANNIDTIAVATLKEAIDLRDSGVECPILVLSIVPPMYANILIKYNLTALTSSYKNASALSSEATKHDKIIQAFVAVDTGMGRIGFLPNAESIEEISRINKLPNMEIRGMLSHFATADEKDKTYSKNQLLKYEAFYENLVKYGVTINFRTFANSAAIMELPESHYEAVRPGIIIYGCYPSSEVNRDSLSLKPAMSIRANIVHLKKVNRGFSVSYGRKFTTKKESLIATISLGYADGYPRCLSGKGRVIINGVYAPVVGNICMDHCMVDVSEVPDVEVGDEVVVMGSQAGLSISADELAEIAGTINYEILCAFGQRLPKIYVSEEYEVK